MELICVAKWWISYILLWRRAFKTRIDFEIINVNKISYCFKLDTGEMETYEYWQAFIAEGTKNKVHYFHIRFSILDCFPVIDEFFHPSYWKISRGFIINRAF